MILRYVLVFSLLCLIGLSSCKDDGVKELPDVSVNDPQFKLIRFDQELWSLDTNDIISGVRQLEERYPAFADLYFSSILLIRKENKYDEIKSFIRDPRIKHIQDTTTLIIGSLEAVRQDLYRSFQYLLHYFPEKEIPDIFTFISEYAYQSLIFDDGAKDGIGLGLDMFLGIDYPYQNIIPNNPAFSKYLIRSFNKEHMAKKAMETIIADLLGESKGNTLLDKMIHNGKKIYILDQLMPFVSDTVIMEYTPDQLKWCYDNEIEMWGYFFSEKLFYSNDIKRINKLTNPSPHSSGMPTEAPGRTANFIGWQIIKSFMKRHPEKSLKELIGERNAQEILEKSKYKPRSR